ncbi:leucine-rich repeat protein [Bacillus ndiopicus]|uniref:leucine-rich repeat protein n=1 Tax=Bacillus ndiopicus TaxID=1347368 RepID=UPI0005AAF8F6|nr:leucine-rich repeat protein [Bacillus ndiopicus]
MKKFGLLLTMLLIMLYGNSSPVDAAEENGFHYDIIGGEVVITAYQGPPGEIVIPATLGGEPVVRIGVKAFLNKGLTKVELPNTVKAIEMEAFAKNELTTIILPDSVEILDSDAFRENQLETVQLSTKLTAIGIYAFDDNMLTTVKIPHGVTVIGEGAFRDNPQLTTITLPDTLTTIGGSAFSNCGLMELELPSSVETIKEYAFYGNDLTTLTLPDSVTTVGSYAFKSNQLATVYLSPNINTIDVEAFSENKLTSVVIPAGVEIIGNGAFLKNGITNIDLSANTVKEIRENAFLNNQLLELTLPPSVTTLGANVFMGNQLTTVNFSPNLKKIAPYAFHNNKLTNIALPEGVEIIDQAAFARNMITNVDFSNTIQTIGQAAFSNNYLTNIIFPSSLSNLGHWAFQENNLDTVIFNSNPSIGQEPFQNQGRSGAGEIYSGMFTEREFINQWDSTASFTPPLTIYAKYEFQVSFDSQGGTTINPLYIVSKGKITEPVAPSKTNLIFDAWYKDMVFNEKWDFATDIVTKPLTLYANWVPQYSITFETDGGSTIVSQNIAQNGKIALPAPPTKEGYTFEGWYKEAGLNTKWDFANDKVTANMTLYAKWLLNTYTVGFNTNGGSLVASQSVAYQQKATEPATPTRTGYTFAGWYKDAQLTEQWNFTTDVVTQNITLYAKWTAKPIVTPPVSGGGGSTPSITYTVQFQTNGGTAITAQTKDYNDKIVEPVPPTKEGYTFVGWYTDSALTKKWDFTKDTVQGNMTLYAKWIENVEDTTIPVENPDNTTEPEQELPACTTQFTDIVTHWAKDMIEDIAGRCWIKGYPDSTFKPNDPIQRQHVAVIFARAFDLPATREMQDFTDVSANHRYYDAIAKMYQAGVFDGVDGKFKPEAPMTRAHMAKLLVEAFDLTSDGTSTFQDVPATHWAKDYIAILADNEVALGDNGNFKPNDPVTRAQFVAFMYRALHL